MPGEFKDYYADLGVKKDASPEEIKAAYRRLAKTHHPDLHPEAGKTAAAAKFKAVNEAYQVLSDPEKRRKYDSLGADWEAPPPPRPESRSRRRAPPPDAESFAGFSDFFQNLYGGGEEAFTRGRPRGGQDIEAEMTLTLEDAVRGGEKKIMLDERTITARLPPAVRDGMKLRLRGQGASFGGEPGDLYLRIRLLPHPDFKVTGPDLETTITVMPWTAALGGEASVPTLEGPVKIKIPAGTRAGRVLRVAGRGLGREGGGRGDLHAAVRIDIPARTSPQIEKLYRELKKAAG